MLDRMDACAQADAQRVRVKKLNAAMWKATVDAKSSWVVLFYHPESKDAKR